MVRLVGGRPVAVTTNARRGFSLDVESLEACRTARTQALLLTSPSNPTGAVLGVEALREIAAWALEHGIWVVSDEIYGELVFDGLRPTSIVAACPDIAERAVVVHGASKAFAMTGWRAGWLIAPRDVVAAATKIQSHTTSHTSAVAQVAAVAALSGARADAERYRTAYSARRDRMLRRLEGVDGLHLVPPRGAFYAFPSFATGGAPVDDVDLARYLMAVHGVATVPGSAFGAPSHLRLSFTVADDDLDRATDALVTGVAEYTKEESTPPSV